MTSNVLSQLIWVDYVILGIIAISAIIGLFRGFVKEAFSLGGWVVAIIIGIRFNQGFAVYLVDYIELPFY